MLTALTHAAEQFAVLTVCLCESRCAGCGNDVYTSATKFESGTGWPSFWDPVQDSVDLKPDYKIPFFPRTEVRRGIPALTACVLLEQGECHREVLSEACGHGSLRQAACVSPDPMSFRLCSGSDISWHACTYQQEAHLVCSVPWHMPCSMSITALVNEGLAEITVT